MPEDQFQLLIRKTIQYNKRVKLDEKDSTGLFSKQEQETVLFSVHRGKGLEMVPLSELLENMNLKEKTDKEEEKAKEKGAMKSEDIDSFADSATINSPISYRNILDQEIPDFRDQSPLLLPRSLLRSPPAYTSSLVTPPLPPVGPRLLQAVRLAYHHLSGSNLLQAARSFDPILSAPQRFSAPQRGANYDTFRRTNFARKADIEIEQEPGYENVDGMMKKQMRWNMAQMILGLILVQPAGMWLLSHRASQEQNKNQGSIWICTYLTYLF